MTKSRLFERANIPLGAAPVDTRIARVRQKEVVFEDAPVDEPNNAKPVEQEHTRVAAPQATLWQRVNQMPFKKRALLLATVIAVPAMAAPGDFGALPGDASRAGDDFATRKIVEAALPFERPGQSFPGSAFYYLGDPPEDALLALPTTDAFDSGAEGARTLGSAIDAGPSARPFFSATSGSGHMRALDCMAQAIWYEAASESIAGQRAVAQVVLNRVAHPNWPGSVCGVVYQGSQRSTGCQFSFTCDGSLSRKARGRSWDTAQRLASEALSGSVYAPIGHATHYHTLWVNPYWASSLDHVGTIGAHRFYRNRGSAGEKAAFTGRYAGVEPAVSGRTSPASPADMIGNDTGFSEAFDEKGSFAPGPSGSDASTPDIFQRQDESAAGTGKPAATKRYAAPALEGSGSIKSDFSNAGQWKKRPDSNASGSNETSGSPD